MAKNFPASASQDRLLGLFGLTSDGTTEQAKAILSAAGLPETGIPAGLTPAKAKKLSDDELVAMFPAVNVSTAVSAGRAMVESQRAAKLAAAAYWERRSRERREAASQRLSDIQLGISVPTGNAEDILDDLAAANVQPADQALAGLREDGE